MKPKSAAYQLDDKVIPFILAVGYIFFMLLAFRYKNDRPCGIVKFNYITANKDDIAYENDVVYFKAVNNANAKEWKWNFGDKTGAVTAVNDISHKYTSEGDYTVSLTMNGKCVYSDNITISKRKRLNNKLTPLVLWPAEKMYALKEYEFRDSTAGATSWSWIFENEDVPQRTRTFTKQFNAPGTYRVLLKVQSGNAEGIVEKKFTVLPAPVEIRPVMPTSATSTNPYPQIDHPSIDPDKKSENGGSGSIPDVLPPIDKGPVIPVFTDPELRVAIISINGTGESEIRKRIKDGNWKNCDIVFNQSAITLQCLKRNIEMHSKFPKSLTASQILNAKDQTIKTIIIDAQMEPEPSKKVIVTVKKAKPRNYPPCN